MPVAHFDQRRGRAASGQARSPVMGGQDLTADFTTDPYWWSGLPAAIENERPAPLPARMEVVVVGSGVTGLNAALVLARGGREVLVAEAGVLGEGASTRNNATMVPYLRATPDALERRFGQDRGQRISAAAVESFLHLANFIETEAIDCDFSGIERFIVALTPAHFDHMVAVARLYEERGIETGWEPISGPVLEARTGRRGYAGAIAAKRAYSVHPGKLHAGLLDLARKAGVALASRTRVERISRTAGSGFLVETSRGQVAADRVAIATNGYTSALTPWLRRRVIPVKAYMAASEPVQPEVMDRLFPVQRSFSDSKSNLTWIRTSPDRGRILFGGRTGAKEGGLRSKAVRLRAQAAQIVPELADLRISHCWEGRMAFTFDQVPHIGVRDGLHYAVGFCGVGLTGGSWLGTRLGQQILGLADGATAFDDGAFPSRLFYTGNPWFLPLLFARMNLRDKMDRRKRAREETAS